MKPVNCCVPLCINNFRNSPNLSFYRIPKDSKLQKKYVVLMRNKNLKLKSDNTRICSAHFEGGEKLSRNHLPSIFPWNKEHTNVIFNPETKLNKQGEMIKTRAVANDNY